MQVSVSLLPDPKVISSKTDVAVVIDVLRATSVMTTALANGAAQIITCQTVEEALQLASSISPRPLLCGERGCKLIDGFDCGNSPAEYTPDRVAGRSLILTTTNGTAAIESSCKARRMIAASFLNLASVCDHLESAEQVGLVCSGTNGSVTAEDVLLAGAIVNLCEQRFAACLKGDEAVIARQLWRSWFPDDGNPAPETLGDRLRGTQGGRNLVEVGYQDDLVRCAAVDSLPIIPQRMGDNPTIFGVS